MVEESTRYILVKGCRADKNWKQTGKRSSDKIGKKTNGVDLNKTAPASRLIWIYTVCKTCFLVCGTERVK